MANVIIFWLLFFLLNSLFFWPRNLLEPQEASILPGRNLFTGPRYNSLRHLLIRPGYDICKICIDFVVLGFVYTFLLKHYIAPGYFTIILVSYFGWSLSYQVYYSAFQKLYHIEPVLFNDHFMIKTAFSIFIHEYDRKNFLITICAVVAGALIALLLYLFSLYAFTIQFGGFSYALILLFGLGSAWSLWGYEYKKYPYLTFQSPLQSLLRNLLRSRKYRRQLGNLTLRDMEKYNPPKIKLQTKPNIFLILIESYGKILYDQPDFLDEYRSYMKTLESRLQDGEWKMRSNFSLSPVTGGASWLAYTSILYGLRVEGQGVFLSLLKNRHIARYRSLLYWLKDNGYRTFRLNSLGGYENMKIPWEDYSRMYGIDQWIRYQNLNYRGKLYGFGPSPPDQYSLHYAEEKIRNIAGGPFALFFLTQNSHTPFESPAEVVEDYKDLIDPLEPMKEPSRFWQVPDFNNYTRAIRYQLEFLINFILKQGREEDIFILLGDHQPASTSIRINGFETPMHIISKKGAFVDHFEKYGFQEGLLIGESKHVIRHEAIYSVLQRAIIDAFTEESDNVNYLSGGIPYTE